MSEEIRQAAEKIPKRLRAFEVYQIAKEKNLSHEEYKNLLTENDIIIPKELKMPHEYKCRKCYDTGQISFGGSFGGPTSYIDCECVMIEALKNSKK